MNSFFELCKAGFTQLIIASLTSSIIILLILMVKKGLKKHISFKWQYHMDLLFLILLIVPFVPAGLLNLINIGSFSSLRFGQAALAGMDAVAEVGTGYAEGTGWLQDFSVSVERAAPEYIIPLLMVLWLLGIAGMIFFTYFTNRKLRLVKESAKLVTVGEMAALFDRCKAELGISKRIRLGTSIIVKSPMTIGLINTYVILPADIRETLSVNDIGYILLHELTHCKNKDVLVNHAMCLFQILYWFNPLVYFAFKEMRLDREIACDLSVLKRLPEEAHFDYGKTLLNFAFKLSHLPALSFVADMGGSKPQIKKRIESIASFVKESKLLKVKSICIFCLAGLLILVQIPAVAALASDEGGTYQFQDENIVYKDLSSYFDGLDGSFVLYDLAADLYTIHNQEKSVTRVSPASTYKIYSALIALETGVISPGRSVQNWDGTAYPYETWNQDQDLMSAMQNSVSWYFQTIDTQVGMKQLKDYYTQLSYGNQDLSGGTAEFWMESSLQISPVEQVALLRNFYLNNTIFNSEHVDTVKDTIRLSEKDGAVLSGKTGTGAVNGKVVNGWFIGYVEKNGQTYIFAANIQGEDDAGGSAAAQITLSILEGMGIY